MFSHFINLLARSWDGLMTATSSSTFGFWLWTICGGFFTGAMGTFLFKIYTAVKEGQEKELLTWLRESVLVGGFASSCAIALAVMAWIAFIIPTVYRDHQSLVEANQELRGLMKDLRTSESDHRHFMNVLSGFTGYRMRITGASATQDCLIYSTAPDNTSHRIAVMVSQMASQGTQCPCYGPMDVNLSPEERKKAETGMVDGVVIFHARENDIGAHELFGKLATDLPLRRSYEVPVDSPEHFVWLQYGKNVKWNYE